MARTVLKDEGVKPNYELLCSMKLHAEPWWKCSLGGSFVRPIRLSDQINEIAIEKKNSNTQIHIDNEIDPDLIWFTAKLSTGTRCKVIEDTERSGDAELVHTKLICHITESYAPLNE